jgi:putative FmdB family regulatory protein
MPFYDYECKRCGPFSDSRPMAECADPLSCPECGASSKRAFLRAPAISCSDAGTRKAMALNEKARNEPKLASKHSAGCGCCSTGRKSVKPAAARAAAAAKSFPSARPWMISH